MIQFILIGFGAGAAAALLFASVISGSWLSVVLFYLAPLPVMIAGLGWSHWSALIAAFTGAVVLGVAFGGYFFLAFLAGAGLPAWWLGYLALLARPAGNAPVNGGAPELEWYPPGRLATWAAVLGALTVTIAIANFGLDGESVRANLHHALAQLLRLETAGQAGAPAVKGISDPKALLDFLVEAVPPAAAVLSTLTYLVNLWLAGRIVKFSGRLNRPWPVLSAMTYPRAMAAALAHRRGAQLRARPRRHPGDRRGVGAAARLRRARLRRAACGEPDDAVARLPARRRLRGGAGVRLAAAAHVPDRPRRHVHRPARARRGPARRPAGAVLIFSFNFRNTVQLVHIKQVQIKEQRQWK